MPCPGPAQSSAVGVTSPGDGKTAEQAQPRTQQPASGTLVPAGSPRQVARTANLALKVADVGATVAKARGICGAVGGYVGDENSGTDHATMTMKVPAERLSSTLDQLAAIGAVATRTEHAEDVTEQAVDIDGRLAAQQASLDRVRALFDRATSVSDIVSIESEVTKREADLESLRRRHDVFASQVALATVSVEVTRADAAKALEQPTFLSGLGAGWGALITSLRAVSVAIGAALPFLGLLAVPTLVALLWIRRRVSGSQVSEAESASPPSAEK